MDYSIDYFSVALQQQVLELPDALAARYVVLARRMVAIGPNLGMPHTKAMGGGGCLNCDSKAPKVLHASFTAR